MDFVKIFFKYENEFIDENKFISLLSEYLFTLKGTNYNIVFNLIQEIAKINNEDIGSVQKYEKICDLVNNNEYFKQKARSMSAKENMLMITDYIKCRVTPDVSQEYFNEMVEEAISTGKDAMENCWRLAMTYDGSSVNISKIIDFIIGSYDVNYTFELISTLDFINKDKIVDKIIKTGNKEYIKELVSIDYIKVCLNKEQIETLKKELDEK